ncbi:MAG TPA: hypothetical protein VKD90_15510 [Gemmataceae bacterium]|nr:hypothetical protein [Gemmataceae bacterium]
MNRRIFFVLAVGIVVIAATAWKTYPRTPKSYGDTSQYKFIHCPRCNREEPFTPGALDKECPYCSLDRVPTAESVKGKGGPPNPYGRMFALVFAELTGVMAAILVVTRKVFDRQDEDFLYFNCDHCRQKIRYREAQVGQPAMCRRCKRGFVYPPEGSDD